MLEVIKKKTVWVPLVAIFLLIIGFYLKYYKSDDMPTVTAEFVEKRDIVHKVNASGTIQPEEEVQITSMVSGWITNITVLEGDTVKPGQHLISIDKKQYQAAYDQALSQVRSSKANLKNIKSQLDRTKTLFSQKLISKQELEQIEASYELASSQVEQARAALLSREDELSKTKLVAPKYGIVTSLSKEEGEMALGGMFNPGVLMTIADLSYMEVLVDVNENDVVTIDVGDTTEIEIDAFPDTLFYGLVSEIAHTAQNLNMGGQQQVTNFKVKVKILNPPEKIRPGMSSTVNIISQTIKNTISIPIQSLVSRPKNFEDLKQDNPEEKNWDDEDYSNIEESIDVVFILVDDFDGEKVSNGEKYAIVKPVNVGLSSEDYYSVQSGIVSGNLIVTGRYRVLSKELQHGMKVSYKKDLPSN
ncbi:efflux RND transporter periplasmic adaptor subunit [bacterium]|jgi:HlyD family secretion protein|nr:efflux RND transporter periplasmic adaptor subunit [bacterium]MBT4249102.1 efflux RND transporter periplasmic adaptor subunit [bacterium]MBT5734952.1 efflux RND transporter periplasmic adaptor subunit [bacterium]MBT6018953.1 efflux RND transporter periplasmic adaptor subunit [bacterium]